MHIFHKTYDRKQWVLAVKEKKNERKKEKVSIWSLVDFENAKALYFVYAN